VLGRSGSPGRGPSLSGTVRALSSQQPASSARDGLDRAPRSSHLRRLRGPVFCAAALLYPTYPPLLARFAFTLAAATNRPRKGLNMLELETRSLTTVDPSSPAPRPGKKSGSIHPLSLLLAAA